jgi:hypothetical protein
MRIPEQRRPWRLYRHGKTIQWISPGSNIGAVEWEGQVLKKGSIRLL